jgi:predicted ATPase
MGIRIIAENYRPLRKIAWDLPKGVCALVGPNGSGKTTLLEVPEVLRDVLANGADPGLSAHGDYRSIRNLHAGHEEDALLGIDLIDGDSVDLRVRMQFTTPAAGPQYRQTLSKNGTILVDDKGENQGGNPLKKAAYETFADPRTGLLQPPMSALTAYRLYPSYAIDYLRRSGSPSNADTVLDTDGKNAFCVMRNWRDKRATRERDAFVIENLREAFPDVFGDLDLDVDDKGHRISGRVIAPGASESLPVLHAPSGLLTGLLHLTAVASTPPGGIVAIDEPENGLHPFAVKRILEAMRDWAEQHDLTVLLATHSTVLIDEFKREPERLFVMEPGREVLPVRVDEVRDREWLAQFSLGDLYKHGDFGAPVEGAAAEE